MLFLIDWKDRVSLVVDHENQARATQVALEVAEGVVPTRVRALPAGAVVLELFAEDGAKPSDPDVIVLRALPHVLDTLGELLEDDDGAAASHLRVVPPAAPVPRVRVCESEADAPNGTVVRCELPLGHGRHHVGADLAWEAE